MALPEEIAFQLKPREDYALMKAKLTFPVSNVQTSPAWRAGDAICQGLVLPKLPIRAKLNSTGRVEVGLKELRARLPKIRSEVPGTWRDLFYHS